MLFAALPVELGRCWSCEALHCPSQGEAVGKPEGGWKPALVTPGTGRSPACAGPGESCSACKQHTLSTPAEGMLLMGSVGWQ